MTRVIITIEGGLIHYIVSDSPLEVKILDRDIVNNGDANESMLYDNLYQGVIAISPKRFDVKEQNIKKAWDKDINEIITLQQSNQSYDSNKDSKAGG